jgi:hypothetical protein
MDIKVRYVKVNDSCSGSQVDTEILYEYEGTYYANRRNYKLGPEEVTAETTRFMQAREMELRWKIPSR